MNIEHPTIAFTVETSNNTDGPAHCVYAQGYGLEMNIDDEWPINTIIMAPPHLVFKLTRSADVTSMGAIAGASYTPGDGDYRQISENNGRWVLARKSDDISRILDAGLGVLLHLEEPDELDAVINNDKLNDTRFIVAFQIDGRSNLQIAQQTASAIHAKLVDCGIGGAQILVSGSFGHKNLHEYMSLPYISGLLLLDAHFSNVIDLRRSIAG